MKRFGILFGSVFVFALCGPTQATANTLIVNGSFELPNESGSWSLLANGSLPGWTTTDPAGLIEIDNPAVFGGGSAAYDGTQSLEVNANHPEDVQQTVTGLTVGQSYVLSWVYGDRPGSGDEELQVFFGSNLVATNTDTLEGSNSAVLWFPNAYIVTATSTSEVLSFNGVYVDGSPSYGNELDAVSLVATPEPSTLLLFVSGLCLLGWAAIRHQSGPLFIAVKPINSKRGW